MCVYGTPSKYIRNYWCFVLLVRRKMQLFPFQVDSFPWLKENFGVSSLLLYFVTRIKFQPAVGGRGCARC